MKHLAILKRSVVALALVVGMAPLAAPVSVGAASKTSTPCVARELRSGVYNDTCVGYIQKMLNSVNSAKLAVDNDFGPKTDAAVRNWQKRIKIPRAALAVDGIVGEKTWASLCSERSEYQSLAKRAGCGKTPATKGSVSHRACSERVFSTSKNSRDHCIRPIHHMLNTARGVYLDPAGRYASKTSKAVREMQKEADITTDRSGTIGAETWDLLCGYDMGNAYGQTIYNRYARQAGCDV